MSVMLRERDHVAWLAEQAAAMRRLREDGSNLPLDLDLLAEELEDMGREIHAACASFTILAMQNMLKLAHSPAQDPRHGWANTVATARAELALRMTPTIEQRLRADLDKHYRRALLRARNDLLDHHEVEAAKALPERCPWTLDEILDEGL